MERIEALEQEHRDLLNFGFKVNHGQGNGRALEDDQRAYFAKLRIGVGKAKGMPLDELATFPGMPNYKKGPVS